MEACLKKLPSLKHQFLDNQLNIGHLNPHATHSRKKIYNTVDFLWLNIVLTSLGYISIREKRHFLEFLNQSKGCKQLISFYRIIGIAGFTQKVSSVGFFSDWIKYFDKQQLETVQNKALRAISFVKSEFNLLSIDGKDIRNCNGRNVKSINVVVNQSLRGSYIADSELTWIKNKLPSVIEDIFQEDPDKYVFIGDGIYHNTAIRNFFEDKGYLAILPMMGLTHQFKERLNTTVGLNISQNKHTQHKTLHKRNGSIIDETVTLIPCTSSRYRDFDVWTYVIHIETRTTKINDGVWTYKDRRFLTNIKLPCTIEGLIKLRSLVRQHWQVETFHQYKDANFLEDKYSKSRNKAPFKSMVNNLARLVQTLCGVNDKHAIQQFRNTLLLLVAFLFIFLAEQH